MSKRVPASMRTRQMLSVRDIEDAFRDETGRLLAEAHTIASRQGCGLVQLTTDRSRSDTLRYCESLGYEDSHHGLKLVDRH